MVSFHGQMVTNTKETSLETRKKAKEFSHGAMVESIRANGKMGCSMEKEFTTRRMGGRDEAFGKMGSVSSGKTDYSR